MSDRAPAVVTQQCVIIGFVFAISANPGEVYKKVAAGAPFRDAYGEAKKALTSRMSRSRKRRRRRYVVVGIGIVSGSA